jgi:hypothetical protein
MNNFKSGSGNLDFGENNGEDDESQPPEASETADETPNAQASPKRENTDTSEAERTQTATETTTEATETATYPYFVRRNNVGDERDTRLEIHLRDTVAEQEHEFRQALAQELETDEVAKTDAREFALLAAFQQPELVAELMQEEGYGSLY